MRGPTVRELVPIDPQTDDPDGSTLKCNGAEYEQVIAFLAVPTRLESRRGRGWLPIALKGGKDLMILAEEPGGRHPRLGAQSGKHLARLLHPVKRQGGGAAGGQNLSLLREFVNAGLAEPF